ncbi:MAG: hypothetical protein REI93_02485 [Pedobacter sp.]|nr:hypothetical protein [Pedobacter sp.]
MKNDQFSGTKNRPGDIKKEEKLGSNPFGSTHESRNAHPKRMGVSLCGWWSRRLQRWRHDGCYAG